MKAILMAEAVQSGAFSIPLGQKFSLQDAGKAHAAAEKGGVGKSFYWCDPGSEV
jgi:hypothetical protein